MIYVFSGTLLKLFADFFLNSIPFNLDFFGFLLQMTSRYDFYSKGEEKRIFWLELKGEFWRNNRWNFSFSDAILEELNS